MTDAPYKSIQAFLSTQTAVPKSAIRETEIGDFFTPVVPPNVVTVLPTELQSYASAYLGSVSAIESSIVGVNTGAITASFSGGAGGGAAATATPTQSAASGAGAVTADGRSTLIVLSGMIAGLLGLVMML